MLANPTIAPPEDLVARAILTLQRNRAYSDLIQTLSSKDSWRLMLACDAAVLAVEHQGAIGLLTRNGYYSVAHTSIRPLMETAIRSVWLLYFASFESVQGLMDGRMTMDLDDMARAIIKSKNASSVKPIAESVLNARSIFHSFAHVGIQQLTRRRHGFRQEEVLAGLYFADTFASIAVACLASVYHSSQLQLEVDRQARAVAEEGHVQFGAAMPGDEFRPTMPVVPEWRDPY